VLVGVVGEFVTELTKWIKEDRLRHLVEKLSVLILIVGIAGEIVCQVQSNNKNSLIVGVLNERAGTAEKAAAEAKLELAKMQEDRNIEPQTTEALVAGLRRFGRQRFWIIRHSADSTGYSEPANLVSQFLSIFTRAGWTKDRHALRNDPNAEDPETVANSSGDMGCQVVVSFDSRLMDAQILLISELKNSHVLCKTRQDAQIAPDIMVVEIAAHGG
jgi:hypothetical protein